MTAKEAIAKMREILFSDDTKNEDIEENVENTDVETVDESVEVEDEVEDNVDVDLESDEVKDENLQEDETETETETETEETDTEETEEQTTEDRVTLLEEKIANLEEMIGVVLTENTKLQEQKVELSQIVEEMGAEPAVEPIVHSPEGKREKPTDIVDIRIEELKKLRK